MTVCDVDPVIDAGTAHLRVSAAFAGGARILAPEGELDRWTVSSAGWGSAVAEACADTGTTAVLLDLRRLYFLDLDGLTSLQEFERLLRRSGRRLLIAGVRPRIREFLRNNAPVGRATEYPSFEEAVEQLASPLAPAA